MQQQDLQGKVAVITGANSGIGLEAAVKLAARGSIVVMACRNAEKAQVAVKDVLTRSKANPSNVVVLALDLADLGSVASFRAKYDSVQVLQNKPIDMLILNAGIMAVSKLELTSENVELQMGTNVMGHFKLTHELLDKCSQSENCRIVVVSSFAHKMTTNLSLGDLSYSTHSYSPWTAYAESKLGNLLFMHKLNRLLEERNIKNITVVGCHPGYTATNLQEKTVFKHLNFLFAQSGETGCEPTVLAATDLNAKRNAYAGPWFFEYRGSAKWGCDLSPTTKNVKLQDDLWAKCVEVTGSDIVSKL